MKRLILLVCLVAVPLAIFATSHEPYQGDFDLDGDVDYTDFLTFASNYGKTGGSTTPITRVDTVRVVVRDTIYINSGGGGNTGNGGGGNQGTQTAPPGLASLAVHSRKIATGISIGVRYWDRFGSLIIVGDEIWRNPDKITVTIHRGNTELYRSNPLLYQRDYRRTIVNGVQLGIDIIIPESEILNIYADWSSSHTTRVVVEFDGKEYSGEE